MTTALVAPFWLLEFRTLVGDDGIRLMLERLKDGRLDPVLVTLPRDEFGRVIETRVNAPALVARRGDRRKGGFSKAE